MPILGHNPAWQWSKLARVYITWSHACPARGDDDDIVPYKPLTGYSYMAQECDNAQKKRANQWRLEKNGKERERWGHLVLVAGKWLIVMRWFRLGAGGQQGAGCRGGGCGRQGAWTAGGCNADSGDANKVEQQQPGTRIGKPQQPTKNQLRCKYLLATVGRTGRGGGLAKKETGREGERVRWTLSCENLLQQRQGTYSSQKGTMDPLLRI